MNVWLDDKRPMPKAYDVHVLKAPHAIKLLRCGLVKMISLDHDLGDEMTCGTGYQVACEIERLASLRRLRRITVYVHSMNPVGAQRMRQCIGLANALWDSWDSPGNEQDS
jgi:hypothetical protein